MYCTPSCLLLHRLWKTEWTYSLQWFIWQFSSHIHGVTVHRKPMAFWNIFGFQKVFFKWLWPLIQLPKLLVINDCLVTVNIIHFCSRVSVCGTCCRYLYGSSTKPLIRETGHWIIILHLRCVINHPFLVYPWSSWSTTAEVRHPTHCNAICQ